MVSRKCKGRHATWKFARRCVFFTTTVCVIPIILVFLVTTDQYMRAVRVKSSFTKPQIDHFNSLVTGRNWSEIELRLEKRRKHLKKYCRLLGLDILGNDTLHRPNPWEFLIDRKHHLLWCNVFKAASTSWMYNFNVLAGYSPRVLSKSKLIPLMMARKRYPRPSLAELQKAFNDSISFIIVRHPLERLLSAYRDKFQYALPHSYHQKLGLAIIAKYRDESEKKASEKKERRIRSGWPKFSEFVRYLLDKVKEKEPFDMHWTPITQFCTPCMFDFQIIAHTETLQEDQNYIIHKARLEGIIKPEWRNRGKGLTSNQITKYYSQLTRAQILRLYHIYRYDFELFNYSLDGYIDAGRPDEDPSTLLSAINLKEPSK